MELTDWKGNAIKPGDEIVFVRVKALFSQVGMFVPTGKRGEFEHRHVADLPEHVWELGDTHEVVEKEGVLFYKVETETLTYYFQVWSPFQNPAVITCIKGKSDSEEMYYQELFKA